MEVISIDLNSLKTLIFYPGNKDRWVLPVLGKATRVDEVATLSRACKSDHELTNFEVLDVCWVSRNLAIVQTGNENMLSRQTFCAFERRDLNCRV